jgi:hypothetical protein
VESKYFRVGKESHQLQYRERKVQCRKWQIIRNRKWNKEVGLFAILSSHPARETRNTIKLPKVSRE